jgi:hypothetical protein
MYTFFVFALNVSATQSHLQATHLFKESTALCALSIVLLKYVVVIINFGVIGYLFFLTFCIAAALCTIGCASLWLYLVLICTPSLCTL